MKTLKHILALALLLVFTACNDEFLERLPETAIGIENFFNTEEDLFIYTNDLYDGKFPGTGMYIDDAATDNATTTGNTELKSMMVGAPSASTITGGWDWEELRKINLFLENFQKADVTEERLNHYEGLARFFRALFYIDKVKRYSDVPWYDKTLGTSDEDLFKPRDSRAMVVDKIFEDLNFATSNIDESTPEGTVNRWVAKAYKARFALYEGTFRKYHLELGLENTADSFITMARDAAKDIMDNGGFALSTDYAGLFTSASLSGNSEVIFHKIYELDLLNSGWWEFMFGNFEVSPSKDLLQSYLMADGSYYTTQAGYETKQFVEEFENRDPRLSATYAYPGWELIYTSTYSQGGGIYIQQLQKNFSGYHQIKGFVNDRDQAARSGVDNPVVRYAEILLIYAEAQGELGALTQGDLDMTVNAIRDRVGMPHMIMAPQVDPVQQARYPNIQVNGQWAELLEIRRERRVELALEGFRHDDLMRWSAGKLLEIEPEGLYFPALGKYDLTGDGIEDIILIDKSDVVPEQKETNSLGVNLIYYKTGFQNEDVAVYLGSGTSGNVQTVAERGNFEEPKYYYRPVPATEVTVNPQLTQIFGW